jgi:hypothetical protein
LYWLIQSDVDLRVNIAKHTDGEVILFIEEQVEPREWSIGRYSSVLITTGG